MARSIDKPRLEQLIDAIGANLKKPTTLVVIGSSVVILLGSPSRATLDIDVWRRSSCYDLADLRQACEAAGIAFDPKGYDEPDDAYLQIVEPGIVQLGVFSETESMLKSGMLEIRRPPLENLIASKLVRGEAVDFDDCAFLIRSGRVSREKIESVIATIEDDVAREAASENLAMIDALLRATASKPRTMTETSTQR